MSGSDLRESALSLSHLSDTFSPATPALPLLHNTGAVGFFGIAGQSRIDADQCEHFSEHLVYLFYGRPAYRPNPQALNTSDHGFRPVSILLNPDHVRPIRRVIPLDSGAFFSGLYADFIPPKLALENFEIPATLEAIQRHITAFFRENKDYYLGNFNSDLALKGTQIAGHTYKSIATATGQTELDDRRATIEVHVAGDIELTEDTVRAVALPEVFLDDDDLLDLLLNDWKADIIPYDIYHDRPIHDIRELMSKIKHYLSSQGML